MARLILLIIVICSILPDVVHADSQMGNYCSAPPYVSRTVIPNIQILMDNSSDMENPAYTDTYDPAKTYKGYFNPGGCYNYSSHAFAEGYKPQPPASNAYTSYAMSDTCPSTAPFRGNLLNWATTSRYDILEDVLLGGNSVSKQSNVNTLLSISGDWTDTTNPATPAKVHNGCKFVVNNANLTVQDVTANSCVLLNAIPAPVAFWDNFLQRFANGFKRLYFAFVHGTERTMVYVARIWDRVGGAARSWATQGPATLSVSIDTGTLDGTADAAYGITLAATGGGNTTYTWTVTTKPSWLSIGTPTSSGQKINYHQPFSGTPPLPGSYTLSGSVADNSSDTAGTFSYTIVVTAAPLIITSPSSSTTNLPAGTGNAPYIYSANATGGIGAYNWSATNLPAGLGMCNSADPNWNAASSACIVGGNSYDNGTIYGTPTVTGTFGSISITVTDSQGTFMTKSGMSMTVAVGTTIRSQQYNVKVGVLDEPLNDLNGNNVWDLGETFTDQNGNGVWDGKQGLLQKFWDSVNPRARWGLMDFGQSGNTTKVVGGPCIPASPINSFLTGVQNATATPNSPLAQGLYGALNYYANTGTGYQGCSNADPIPDDSYQSCRKNFVLVISSGSNVGPASGYNFSSSGCTVPNGNNSAPLVQNACYGFNQDLRSDRSGKQNVYTYIVNTMGTNGTNNAILQDAAIAGGGKYYAATDASELSQQLQNALTDILASAASGTAVSVLTTSSRGSGSMIQSYFLPIKQDGTRQVMWTGYTQNLWIDPKDNLREDTANDYQLRLDQDNVLKLYFDGTTNQTMAATFTTLADGTGGTLSTCSSPTIKPFSSVSYLWEAGQKLAQKEPSSRIIFTSKNVIRGTNTTYSFTDNPYPTFTTSNESNTSFANALNPDATYTADSIIRYVRGECLETGVQGDAACGSTLSTTFRDRRLTVGGSLKVWKLGDVISSTPKVFSDTPLNTYHIDYGDSTYYSYITSSGYANKSAIAFVGANDGMLHAFRVGYQKASGLLAGLIAWFQNLFSGDTGTDKLGEEVWSFIPFNAFPYLKYLADPAYCHMYYNDLSVRLVDASIGDSSATPTTTKTQSSWRTILIGGMRFGGAPAGGSPAPPAGVSNVGFSAYYALDVTDPENPVPLWEFSDDDMGYATTYPAIIRTGDSSQNGNWYVVIGSGSTALPKSQTDIGRSTTGYIYILDLKTGALVKKIDLGGNAIVGDILSIDANKDSTSEKLYFGTSYLSSGVWNGQLMSLSIPSDVTTMCGTGVSMPNASCTSGSTPVLRTLFQGGYPFTASPDATKDTDGNIWVYAGSGKYYSDLDESDNSSQIFFGLKDIPSATYYPLAKANLDDRTSYATTGTVASTAQVCGYSSDTNSFGFQTYVTSINPTSSAVSASAKGWVFDLSSKERVISRPLAVGGVVDFLTYVPSSDPCSYGGNSYLYSLGYTTGVAPNNVSIYSPGITGGTTTDDVTVQQGILLGPGAPPTGEAIIIPPPKEGANTLKKKIQVSTGVIVEAENQPVLSVVSKIVHWLKK
jgi:Tfp pilus tip-associated adhesin PilY1